MTSDAARTAILSDIRKALAGEPPRDLADAIDPMQDAAEVPDRASLAVRFKEELALLAGETFFVASETGLPAAIAAFADARGLAHLDRAGESNGYALIAAQALFADTGAALAVITDEASRLSPYLPRTCIITADAAQLHPAMTRQALAPLFEAARASKRGEAVIIAGPSRTADIEKTIVLGAHGPRALAVFITGIADPNGAIA